MLLIPISVLAISTITLIVVLVIVAKEQTRGKRLFLTGLRGWLDRVCDAVSGKIKQLVYVGAVSFRYVIHQLRAALARAIAPRPRRTKKQPDRLQFEKTDNHLSSMHDHKSDTALTPSQKKKLRNQKLEERL